MDPTSYWIEVLIAAGIVGGLLLAAEIGFVSAKRLSRGQADKSQVGAVQAALLGLLGLLLGLSFAGAAGRFGERQDLITREASTLGTAYLRTDLLPEPWRGTMRGVLRAYADERVALAFELRPVVVKEIRGRMVVLQGELWKASVQAVEADPVSTMAVLPQINDMLDQYTERTSMVRRHLPSLVLGLLIASAALGTFSIGFGNGLSGKRHGVMTVSFTLLVAVALWTTIDLDHPRRGLIQVDQSPLIDARAGMGE